VAVTEIMHSIHVICIRLLVTMKMLVMKDDFFELNKSQPKLADIQNDVFLPSHTHLTAIFIDHQLCQSFCDMPSCVNEAQFQVA